MISAPDATEPSTVTSPCGKTTDWPERTGLSSTSELGSCAAGAGAGAGAGGGEGGGGGRGGRRRVNRIEGAGGTAALQHRRQLGSDLGRIGAFNAHDADVARLQFGHQMGDGVLAEVHR